MKNNSIATKSWKKSSTYGITQIGSNFPYIYFSAFFVSDSQLDEDYFTFPLIILLACRARKNSPKPNQNAIKVANLKFSPFRQIKTFSRAQNS